MLLKQAVFENKETWEIKTVDAVLDITVDVLREKFGDCPAGVCFSVYVVDTENGLTTDIYVSGNMYRLLYLQDGEGDDYRVWNEKFGYEKE